jgi:hypothetical protein
MSRVNWNDIKIERQQRQVVLFRDSFEEIRHLPINLIENDPPDASLIKDTFKIAIELTELRWDKDFKGVDKSAAESNANLIMHIAKQKYCQLNLPPLQVNVSFNDNYGLIKDDNNSNLNSSDKERLSSYIVEKVSENYPKSGMKTVELDEYDNLWNRILDKKICSIWISRFPELTENCWAANGGGVIPSISYEKINEIIKHKNKRLTKYISMYHESWLVIIEDWNGVSGYFNFKNANDVFEARYNTKFDRVFILRSKNLEVIELKTAK